MSAGGFPDGRSGWHTHTHGRLRIATVAELSARDLPGVDRLLRDPRLRGLPHELALQAARDVLENARRAMLDGGWPHTLADLPRLVEERIQDATAPRLKPVLNASGVVIHTNLGRAPLSQAALAAAREAAEGYSNLEYDLEAGERGSRHTLVTDLLRRLTGAEDALVANNNAAAVLLILSALGQGREAIISRGQLVEIGGGFRIPDVMRQSGTTLVEVGTTNRTYAADFEAAITDRTALLLRVHASNFVQVGFVHQPSLEELVEVGNRHGLPVVDDLGSGSLLDTSEFGLAREPMVQASVVAGTTLVAFSGDKLLGGPQAGIIVGRAERSRPLETASADARDSARQADARSARRHPGALLARRGRARGAGVADDLRPCPGSRVARPIVGVTAGRQRSGDAVGDWRRVVARADAAKLGHRIRDCDAGSPGGGASACRPAGHQPHRRWPRAAGSAGDTPRARPTSRAAIHQSSVRPRPLTPDS